MLTARKKLLARMKKGRAGRVNPLRGLRKAAGLDIPTAAKRIRRSKNYLLLLESPSAPPLSPMLANRLAAVYGCDVMAVLCWPEANSL